MTNTEKPHNACVVPIPIVRTPVKKFVLWREVTMAYVSPAIMASIGGWVASDRSLQLGALTTIGGASALVAWLLGWWLQHRGIHNRWIIGAPHLTVVGMLTLLGISLGLFAAWMTAGLAETLFPTHLPAWLDRVWTDFPLSAAVASLLVTWRWRLSTKHFSYGGDTK